jgi:hypothetical protein
MFAAVSLSLATALGAMLLQADAGSTGQAVHKHMQCRPSQATQVTGFSSFLISVHVGDMRRGWQLQS